MTYGTWFAYCDRSRILPLERLGQMVARDDELTVRLDQPNLLVVTVHDSLMGNAADVTVGVDTGDHVRSEAAELAHDLAAGRLQIDPGVPRPDVDALRGDARYELTWDMRFSDETYNSMLDLAELLMHECGAIVYDVTNHRFV